MSRCDLSRRGFLGMLGAGAASMALLPRVQPAFASPPTPKARRVLVLNLVGGIRSSAAFHASTLQRYNPYGLIASTSTPFALGKILDDASPDASYTLSAAWQGARLPRLREIASQFSVVGTWATERGDHQRARIEEPTGSPTGQEPGLLTRVAAGMTEAAGAELEVPPFHLEYATYWGNAQGALNRYAPVQLASYESLPSSAANNAQAIARTGNRYAGGLAQRFDERIVAARAGRGKLVTETFALHKRAARKVGTRLSQRDLAVGIDDESSNDIALGTATVGTSSAPLTNAMLREVFESCLGANPEASPYRTSAIDAALAVRFLQMGSPAVVLEVADFDFHSGERTEGPAAYAFLGRLWAALHWLLSRIPDPSGEGSLLDRTFVTAFSDFGRDGVNGGWNGGEGTDHGVDASCFYLAHPVMGAGVVPNKLVGPVSTSSYDARKEMTSIAPQRYLATILAALGLDNTSQAWGFPEAGAPLQELWS
jgi:uncharacterized protein (DUF1501 family)